MKLTTIIASLTLLGILLCAPSCSQRTQEIIPPIAYASYVNAYTGGLVSRTATIRVELTQPQSVVETGTELKSSPFRFTPALRGSTHWVDDRTLEFVPEQGALKPGKFYKASFQLGDFVQVERKMRNFDFSFRVKEPNFTLELTELSATAETPERMSVQGLLRFSDVVDHATAQKILTATFSSKQLPAPTLLPNGSASQFSFTVGDIPRGEQDTELTINANGHAAGVDKQEHTVLTIPAKGKFCFLSARRITQPENGLQLTFSDPISELTDLKGLITIPELSNYVFQISDNRVNIYFEESQQPLTLNIYEGIRNTQGSALQQPSHLSFGAEDLKPQVTIDMAGSIMPDSKNLILPFRAISLKAVDLRVIRIFESNILSFMQDNTLATADNLRRSGRLVYQKTLRLDTDPTKDPRRWDDYYIDLAGLIKQEPGALYRIVLSFKQEYSLYGDPTGVPSAESPTALIPVAADQLSDEQQALWDRPASYYNDYEGIDWSNYDWEQRDNPRQASYYMNSDRWASCNVLASDLGLICKRNSADDLWITVNNILDTAPVADAQVTAYNFQLQTVGTAKTDNAGFAKITTHGGKPFIITASKQGQKSYLRVVDGQENSTSRFDVGGKEIRKGLKGYLYGERGIWRPGDTLYMTFVLEDPAKRIPSNHPVSIEWYNPRGQFYSTSVATRAEHGFYSFHLATRPDDPTGLWNAYVKVGGTSFHKAVHIETIKPNRLKIELKIQDKLLSAKRTSVPATLRASWLTGATAANLKVRLEMNLTKVGTQFPQFKEYLFNNPATDFNSGKYTLFSGTLDAQGCAPLQLHLPQAPDAPGVLCANITTRVFEPGGDVSIQTQSIPFSPFSSYVGINLNVKDDQSILTDTRHTFQVVSLDPTGRLVDRTDLEYTIYRVDWSWWWENRNNTFSSYINSSSAKPVATGTLHTRSGKASFDFQVDYPDWGRYLVYVKDRQSGHATGGTVLVDWPDWRGRSGKSDPSGVTMLSFSLDKPDYQIGDQVTCILPASAGGRALAALENGSEVLHREWINVKAGQDTKYTFTVTPAMAPNVYLHITLLQPHAQRLNDLPIRMYGVLPILVRNQQTQLHPQLKMPAVLRPEQEFAVTVSEKTGRPMTYTLSIVDEGLLDLTNFSTPNPWTEFYSREALGIRTWDLYDQVIGAHTGSYGSLFSIGGDEMLARPDAKANRFRPVVKFLGPFSIGKGRSQTHRITLPLYVGSVRTMVVAGQAGAYGCAEQTTPVRAPLMLLSSLPRVLSTNEDILLPVNVFAMESGIKNVTVQLQASPNLRITGGDRQQLIFTQTGDQIAYFRIKTGAQSGRSKISITATCGKLTAKEQIEIEVRNPNPIMTLHRRQLLQGSQSTTLSPLSATKGSTTLDISRLPAIDLTRRLDFLSDYPHSCTEQLTSQALPLLLLDTFRQVEKSEAATIRDRIRAAIKALYGRQLPNGGFAYWPGASEAGEWVTSYAGLFLSMASEKGYEVNSSVLDKWQRYQRRLSQNWHPTSDEPRQHSRSDLQQAYRLYTLALYGTPETGAMNRLKESPTLSTQAKWQLATAYALSGKKKAAIELIHSAKQHLTPYSSDPLIYGSPARDQAMILEALVLSGQMQEAFAQAQRVADDLSQCERFDTQSTAFALLAMGRLAGQTAGSIELELRKSGGKIDKVKSAKALFTTNLDGSTTVTNRGQNTLYADLSARVQPLVDTLPASAHNLRLEVQYLDLNGAPINIHKLQQGADFKALITVANISGTTDYHDIALLHIIPSGWEISQEREASKLYDYQDIRDDRVLTYFDLPQGRSKCFTVRLQASYAGTFVLPSIRCEAMYDTAAQARTAAGTATVIR